MKLLPGLRLPGRHAKMIKFHTKPSVESSKHIMFKPALQELEKYGLHTDGTLIVATQGTATEGVHAVRLVRENPNAHPVFIPANQVIECLQPICCLKIKQLRFLHCQVNFISKRLL